MCGFQNGINSLIDFVVSQYQFDFYFGQEINRVFCAAINFRMTFLAAEAFNFADGHAGNADFGQDFAHIIEFERFDNSFDFFHINSPYLRKGRLKHSDGLCSIKFVQTLFE